MKGNPNIYKYRPLNLERKPQFITAKNMQILRLISLGHSNAKIAEMLSIKEKSVKSQITDIYRKLNVKSRSELLAMFLRLSTEFNLEPVIEKRKQELKKPKGDLPIGI